MWSLPEERCNFGQGYLHRRIHFRLGNKFIIQTKLLLRFTPELKYEPSRGAYRKNLEVEQG